MKNAQPYYTERLNSSKTEIRLLEIVSADDDPGPVRCRLRTVKLNDRPVFFALSYLWGDAAQTTPIQILIKECSEDQEGPNQEEMFAPFDATLNLEAALRHVRKRWFSQFPNKKHSLNFLLWVDAVCINQADLEERSEQLGLMQRIYSSATCVLSWLGTQDRAVAFKAIQGIYVARVAAGSDEEFFKMQWMKAFPGLCGHGRNEEQDTAWDQIIRLCSDRYWQRIWIFQEVALAFRVLLVTPNQMIHHSVAKEVAVLMFKAKYALQQSMSSATSSVRPEWISPTAWVHLSVSGPDWPRLVQSSVVLVKHDQVQTGLSSNNQQEHLFKKPMELEGKSGHIWLEWYFVLMHSMKMEATDPKDLVYGLLGVSQLDIKPNYRSDVSVGDVYTEYVSRWLADPRSRSSEVSEPLEFLNDSGSAVAAPGFPSWVPNFEAFSQSRHRRRLSPLAGTVKKGLVTLGSFKTERFPTAAGAKLFGVGYELENVASVSGWSIGQGRTNGELLNFLAANHATSRCGIPFLGVWMRLMILETDLEVSHNTARLAFYLLHDLISENESPELSADQITVQLGRTCHSPDEIEPWEAWILRSFLYRVDTDATTPDSGTINLPHKDEDMEAAAQMRLEETYGSLQDYHIFETEGGRVGVAPDGVEVGDPVCILQGCGLPLILKRKNGGNCEESEYIHFSTSLIVGLMDGEAAGIIEEKKLEPKTIIIV